MKAIAAPSGPAQGGTSVIAGFIPIIAGFCLRMKETIATPSDSTGLWACISIVFIPIVTGLETLLTLDQILTMKTITTASEATTLHTGIGVGPIAIITLFLLGKQKPIAASC